MTLELLQEPSRQWLTSATARMAKLKDVESAAVDRSATERCHWVERVSRVIRLFLRAFPGQEFMNSST